ncbi:sulfur carrier protein ThiS adenylyltransferase ThiF [Peptostreptococcus russellii]|uniref:sulfur carrier protein ThiS adenylyltransferase ThiF n=1 Tax=Peptostreptococcus russellii TaxID=215200 RepID=UPI0026F35027|nr:sulfur carrier protein ThiS adenylyltransferase ThiF [Peptostreptococcus russellii]
MNSEKINVDKNIKKEKVSLEDLSKRNIEKSLEKLQKARVCILGAGGLGSNIAMMLARSSVGYLHIVDFDIVEASNLNRQAYFLDDIGKMKTEAIKNKIEKINPFVKVEIENIKVTERNVGKIIENENIIVEAFDDAKSKAMLVNEVLEKHSGKTIVSASGMAGLEDSNNIKTKRIMKNLYISGDGYTDFEEYSGIMAPRVMICAGHQANTVLRIILEKED